jgi:hypothetical protein
MPQDTDRHKRLWHAARGCLPQLGHAGGCGDRERQRPCQQEQEADASQRSFMSSSAAPPPKGLQPPKGLHPGGAQGKLAQGEVALVPRVIEECLPAASEAQAASRVGPEDTPGARWN